MRVEPHRIALVEDQMIFRELLAEVLEADQHYKIEAQYDCAQDALLGCVKLRPDLVILDVVLPDLDGLEVLSRLRSKLPNMPIIMITAHARPSTIKEAVRRGARGFVTKGTPLSELRTAVAKVLSGGRYFCSVTSPLLADALSQKTVDDTLSPRQREILRLVASGMSSKEIASQLDISVKTVSNHRLQISERLGFTDVASWTRYAMEQGLIEAKL